MLKLIGYPAIVVSSVSLVASVGIMLAALAGWHDSEDVVLLTMILSIIVPMGAMILVFNTEFENLSQRQVMKLVWEVCPKWMQLSGKSLIAVGFLAFLGEVALGAPGSSAEEGGWAALSLGAFGLVIHSHAIVSIFGAMQLQENLARSRCQSGHQIPLGAKFCPDCGERADPESTRIRKTL